MEDRPPGCLTQLFVIALIILLLHVSGIGDALLLALIGVGVTMFIIGFMAREMWEDDED